MVLGCGHNQEISSSEKPLEMGWSRSERADEVWAGELGHTCMFCPCDTRPALAASGSVPGVRSRRRIQIKIKQFNGGDSRCGILPTVGLALEMEECLLPCLLAVACRKDC